MREPWPPHQREKSGAKEDFSNPSMTSMISSQKNLLLLISRHEHIQKDVEKGGKLAKLLCREREREGGREEREPQMSDREKKKGAGALSSK